MSATVFEISAFRSGYGQEHDLTHPVGVAVPFDRVLDSTLITPQIRDDIASGAYSSDMLALLPEALAPGDRVMVIGAGLGILATAAALTGLPERVLAFEANGNLIPRIRRTARANRAKAVDAIHGVLAHGRTGPVPVFVANDLRETSLIPSGRGFSAVATAPFMDMNLILAEEEITVILCDVPEAASALLAQADLRAVRRIVVRMPDTSASTEPGAQPESWRERGLRAGLASQGYVTEPRARTLRAVSFCRSMSAHSCPCGAGNRHAEQCPGARPAGSVPLQAAARMGRASPGSAGGMVANLPFDPC